MLSKYQIKLKDFRTQSIARSRNLHSIQLREFKSREFFMKNILSDSDGIFRNARMAPISRNQSEEIHF